MSFSKLLDTTYSTKRPAATSGGKGGTLATHLTGVLCTPIAPAVSGMGDNSVLGIQDGLTGQVLKLYTIETQYQTHTDGGVGVTQVPDILEGDAVVDGSEEYEVRRVEEWPAASNLLAFLRVVLEKPLQ